MIRLPKRHFALALLCLCFLFSYSYTDVEADPSSPREFSEEEEAIERLKFLRSEIARHDVLYYEKASPEISDQEYDALKRELLLLEERLPDVVQSASTRDSSWNDDHQKGFARALHVVPMLSLEKAYDLDELRSFYERVEKAAEGVPFSFVIEPKIDGMAISLVYQDGQLSEAITRGDGEQGDIVTQNLLQSSGVLSQLRGQNPDTLPKRIELRGEVFVTYHDFEKQNERRRKQGEAAFSHPRNFAAASLKLLDPLEVARRDLSVTIFGYGEFQPKGKEPESQKAFLERVRSWGFEIPAVQSVEGDWQALQSAIEDMRPKSGQLDFPSDGLVVKVNELALQRAMGESNNASRWAIAYKWNLQGIRTSVDEIRIQVSRFGKLVPVAILNPVEVDGATISRATLHSEKWIAQMDLRLGDVVRVERAGSVIPKIVWVDKQERLSGSKPYRFPVHCPYCETEIVRREDVPFCQNRDCAEVIKRRLEHFASRQAVAIRGLGKATIGRWVDAGLVASPADLFRLDEQKLLLALGQVGVSETRILSAIEKSKELELWRLLNGLSIAGVGTQNAKTLASRFETLEQLIQYLKSGDKSELFGSDTSWLLPELEQLQQLGVSVSNSLKAEHR